MLKKSASGVLASLAVAMLDGLFQHPALGSPVVLDVRTIECPLCHNIFSVDSLTMIAGAFRDFLQRSRRLR